MAETRRFNLSLTLNSALQRQAWDIIKAIPSGQRTEQICRMLCSYKDKQQERLLQDIRQIIREELQKLKVQPRIIEKTEPEKPQDVSDDVLGFLLALQEGDDIS